MTDNGASLQVGACLSLSGKFARFGQQALRGLRAWQELDGSARLVIEDDESNPRMLEAHLPRIAAQADIMLGPYSTHLMRAAGTLAAERGWLLWNHGGSGDDVESAHPGHIVSILSPTSRYAEPFLRLLASERESAQLVIVYGKGRFSRQVAIGAERLAGHIGLDVSRVSAEGDFLSPDRSWDLFTVGQFEDDVALVRRSRSFLKPPRHICSVAAGVREFRDAVADVEGVFGIAQWFPGATESAPALGPSEEQFIATYRQQSRVMPDYPAVQAVAGAVLATHCVRTIDGVDHSDLWAAAVDLEVDTLYGAFKIDPDTGMQVKHQTTLVRWGVSTPSAVVLS